MMTNDTALNRREFLRLAVAATVSLCIRSQLPGVAVLQRGQQQLLPMRLVALLTHTESAKAIGNEYLQKYRLEANAHILIDKIASSPAVNDVEPFIATDRTLHELIDRMIHDDFEVERVVKLQGWILSLTEARLCALAALL